MDRILIKIANGVALASLNPIEARAVPHESKGEALYLELFRSLQRGAGGTVNTNPQGSILNSPELELRCWTEIERNVLRTRELKDLVREAYTIQRKLDLHPGVHGQPDHPNWAIQKELMQRQLEVRDALDQARRSKERLSGILSGLRGIKDARAVRLIAPILEEEHIAGRSEDYREESVPVFAMLVLHEMANAGAFKSPQPSGRLQDWRAWWEQNRKEFGGVYELSKAHPKLGPEPEARSVIATPMPAVESACIERSKEQNLPASEPGKSDNWYWRGVALCVALMVGLFVWFRRKA
jgi:hypothetical protein